MHRFSGAIIVNHQGEGVLRKGYGLADREARRPYTPTTVQSHGSITKQATAAAILLLESRGELSVEDSIELYFDEVPEDKRSITVHQLLTHSSGMAGGIGPDNWNQYWNIIWNSDGTYRGTASGPWPSFILVPTAEGQYRAVRQGPPWDTIELRFEDQCLVATELRTC